MEGYRNNAYGCGGGDGSIEEIIFFEMEELGNTDIPKYLSRHYLKNAVKPLALAMGI